MNMCLILCAIVMMACSGVPALLGGRRSLTGQRIAAALMLAGGALGVAAVARAMAAGESPILTASWLLPVGRFSVGFDAITGAFLLPVFVVPVLGALYGLGYWKQSEHPANGRKLTVFYGALAAGMAMVAISRDAVLFLIVWEVMALAAFFLATTEDHDPSVRRAGWVYFVATHIGTLCLIAMFAMWWRASGSSALDRILPATASPSLVTGIFLLAVVGFGFKAGLMPLHVWLPGAHANAPSHVSAVMSGVMLKMGVYGIVRMTSLLPAVPTWWGGLMLAVGAVTGVLGIAFALAQRDLKRLLAYSSIENIGIIAMGLGLALLGRAMNRGDWVVLGFSGAILHVWNHSLFKSLLFLNSGAIIHAVHTREIDRLGGLAKRMPRTAWLFAVGAVAICALPPLNGFASEWLIYLGLLKTVAGGGATWPAAALAVAVLAVIGALATACFVKLLGSVFLGAPRSEAGNHAHDPAPSLLLPMRLLAAACITVGLLPWIAAHPLQLATAAWTAGSGMGHSQLLDLAPLTRISLMAVILLLGVGLLGMLLRGWLRQKAPATAGTWDCGYARPTGRMQYTGSSFTDTLAGMLRWALWPRVQSPSDRSLFAGSTFFRSVVPDAVLDRLVLPVFELAGRYIPALRFLQQGRIQIYVLYILVMVLALLLWGVRS